MKSYVWTYRNKRPVGKEFKRFYVIKNEKQLDDLIEKFLDIDAVTIPAGLKFPVVLELENGFAPSVKEVNLKKLSKELKELQTLVKKME